MEFLLVSHELARMGRNRRTYLLRTLVVSILFLECLVLWATYDHPNSGDDIETFQGFAVNSVMAIQLLIVYFAAPVLAAGSLAQEKLDRTLSLLMLADYRGYDIYIAKAASTVLHVALLSFSLVPLLGFSAFFGGVSFEAVAMQSAKLLVYIVMAASIGMLCATFANRPADAIIVAYVLLAAWTYAKPYLLRLLVRATESSLPDWIYAGWSNFIGPLLIAAAAGAIAVRALPRFAADKTTTKVRLAERRKRKYGLAPGLTTLYRGAVVSYGSAWLSPPLRTVLAIVAVVIFVAIPKPSVFGVLYSLNHWIVMLIVAFDVQTTVETARRAGTFETLAVTPVSDSVFARALLRVHFHRSLVFLPALSIAVLWSGSITLFETNLNWRDAGIAGIAICCTVAGQAIFLWFAIAVSCLAATRKGSTPGRVAWVAANLLFYGMFASIFAMFSNVYQSGVANLTGQPFVATGSWLILNSLTSVIYLFAAVLSYFMLVNRAGANWRNGGGTAPALEQQ